MLPMNKNVSHTKSELADLCGVGSKKVARWCNVDYFPELSKMGYKKTQHEFTPCQWQFLTQNILEYSEK